MSSTYGTAPVLHYHQANCCNSSTTRLGSNVMTALPDWDVVGPTHSDAELALASAAGDRAAFAGIYDRYADRLHDFCVGMLRDREAAADCVQDAFCIAATKMTQLRDPEKLRPWLYSIARSEALRRIRDRRRETVSDELPDAASGDAGPDTLAARTELAELVSEAAGGLSDRDRSVLELTYRHGLDGPDLADALGVSPSNANTIVHRLRETVERSLGALLVSRRVRNNPAECPELATILDGWDGHFTVLMRKRIARHIESCDTCDEERRRMVSPVALLGAAPVFIPAPEWLRDRTLGEVQLTSAASPITADGQERGGTVGEPGDRGFVVPVVAFVAALIAAAALLLVWLNQNNVAVTPTEVSEAVPPPIAPAAPLKPPPPPPAPEVNPPAPAVPPPAPRVPVVEVPSAPPPHVVPPVAEPPAPPPELPPPDPPPPVLPDPVLPQWPDWIPQWPQPERPDPGGGGGSGITGPENLFGPQPDPGRGTAVP
jgi:RNA polymerase sigma factor (sigma-70 family)